MSSEHLIKKYANRRLYDTRTSRHVTLDDIRTLILDGEHVRIVDDRDGTDITRAVLLQVINEQEQRGQPLLSAALLESLIRFYGNPLQSYFTRFLEDSAANFLDQQGELQSRIEQFMQSLPMGDLTELTRDNLSLWRDIQRQFLDAVTGAGAPRSRDD